MSQMNPPKGYTFVRHHVPGLVKAASEFYTATDIEKEISINGYTYLFKKGAVIVAGKNEGMGVNVYEKLES